MPREALPSTYSVASDGKKITCNICRRNCVLADKAVGFCSGYQNVNGQLRDLTYGNITTAQVTRLGWAPVSDYADPNDRILSVGSRGCNMRCNHCVNFEHAFAQHDTQENANGISPDLIVDYANNFGCKGIAANFNEGLLALAYWRDIFKNAKENGLYTVAVTNGYATHQALDVVCPHLDVYRSDIKASSKSAMISQGNRGIDLEGVFDNLLYVRDMHPNVHIETVTMISPGVNGGDNEIKAIAAWINNNLGSQTVWHISPMQPTSTTRKVSPPNYLTPSELGDNKHSVGMSISFRGGDIILNVGEFNFNDTRYEDEVRPYLNDLERIAKIGRSVGLRNVVVKADGH